MKILQTNEQEVRQRSKVSCKMDRPRDALPYIQSVFEGGAASIKSRDEDTRKGCAPPATMERKGE